MNKRRLRIFMKVFGDLDEKKSLRKRAERRRRFEMWREKNPEKYRRFKEKAREYQKKCYTYDLVSKGKATCPVCGRMADVFDSICRNVRTGSVRTKTVYIHHVKDRRIWHHVWRTRQRGQGEG
jgi:hypothetical protein